MTELVPEDTEEVAHLAWAGVGLAIWKGWRNSCQGRKGPPCSLMTVRPAVSFYQAKLVLLKNPLQVVVPGTGF